MIEGSSSRGSSCLRDSAFKSIIIPNGNTLCEPLRVRAKNNFPRLINDLHHQIQARSAQTRQASFLPVLFIQIACPNMMMVETVTNSELTSDCTAGM